MLLWRIAAVLGAFATSSAAARTGSPELKISSRLFSRDAAASSPTLNNTNGPNTRNQWTPGFGINNDTDLIYPRTGVVREYTFTITNTTCNPDGHGKFECMLVNNQYPGPTITANWGDTVKVNVINKLQDNGTSIHFHGVQQLNTNRQDGVNGITECPLAPGKTRTYQWQATQHGTSWWHSHHAGQYGAGIFGPIVINGPSSANYDTDLGPVSMNEWFYMPGFAATIRDEQETAQAVLAPPPDNFLINGKAKDAQGHGNYTVFNVDAKKRHKLRLINTSTQSAMRFSIQSHQLLIVAIDFVPIQPLNVSSVMVGIGQRYDVVVLANQSPGAYWVRADPETSCPSVTKHNGFAVLKYTNQSVSIPPGGEKPPPSSQADDCQAPSGMKPIWPSAIGTRNDYVSQVQKIFFTVDFFPPKNSLIIWKLNRTGIDIEWQKPTLSYIAEHNSSYAPSAAVIELPLNKKWAYWVLQAAPSNTSFLYHPIHLHGHDFYTLGQGIGSFDPKTAQLNMANPIRRDSDYLIGDGNTKKGSWMAIAFQTGNPGAWLLHCHIASHIGQGFGLQFIDSKNKIPSPDQSYYDQCRDWQTFYAKAPYKQIDSGL